MAKKKNQTPKQRQNVKNKAAARSKVKPNPPGGGDRAVMACLNSFLRARVDPFHPSARNACMPGAISPPTFTYTTRAIGEVQGAANEILGVALRPTAANDFSTVFYYSAANPSVTTIMGGSGFAAKGSPFSSSQFSAGALEQRLVGASIRVKSTEPALSVSGSVSGYSDISGQPIAAAATLSTLNGFANTKYMSKHAMLNKWFHLEIDLDDSNAAQQWHGASPNYLNNSEPSVVMFIGASSTGASSVMIETVCHWEVRGRTVAPFAQPKPSDPNLFAKAYNAATDTARTHGPDVLNYAQQFAEAAARSTIRGLAQSVLYQAGTRRLTL